MTRLDIVKKDHLMNLKPIAGRVHIRRDSAQARRTSGLILPETARQRERPWTGVVIAVGPGVLDEKLEKRLPIEVKVGDHVVFQQFSGGRFLPQECEQDELLVRDVDILAVIEEE